MSTTVARATRRRRLSAATAALTALVLAGAAWLHDGVPQADLDLNDGGVWVTSTSSHLVARLNYPSRQVDGSIRTASASFDVTQDGTDVLVPDQGQGSVSLVDPSLVELSGSTSVSQDVTVLQGANRVLGVDRTEGTVRGTTVSALSSLTSARPLVEGQPGLVAAAGTDGSLHAVSVSAGTLTTVPVSGTGWGEPRTTSMTLPQGGEVAVTAVGTDAVVLERTTGVLHLPGGGTTDLGEGGLVLQQPGPAAGSVLVASRTALYTVPLDGSAPTRQASTSGGKDAEAPGVPAAPVRLKDCVYAAWSGSGQFLRGCGPTPEIRHDDTLAASTSPVFRVNRDAIVLNDIAAGRVWLPDEDLVLLDDWTETTAQNDRDADQQDDSADASENQSQPERTEENHPPVAVDDHFGARPGRSTVLPVLANDSDPDGDVLTAVPGDAGSSATVTQAQGGLALRLDVPADATGSVTVPYTADDGRGLSDSAVAEVEIHEWARNEAPTETSVPSLTIVEGASGSLDVLGYWRDPDGDSVYLSSAQGQGMDVMTSNEGTVVVRDTGAGVGEHELSVTVSDGRESATGTVKVKVVGAESALPQANADHVRVVAGTTAVVAPLDNDVSPTGDPLRLAAVSDPPVGVKVTVDQQAGVFSLTADSPQTLYLTYDVAAGSGTAKGIVRIDVVAPSAPSVPPQVEQDTVLLRDGRSTTVAPLSNDFDPAGGILVLQSVQAPQDVGVSVTLVDHSLLQVSAAGPVPEGTEIRYVVSNGTASATGTVSVVPVATTELQVPVVGNDTAVVRAGDVVTVSVLDNDSSPSGLSLSVAPDLEFLDQPLGTAWVSENTVRFKAGQVPGRTTLTYSALDTSQQTASGTLTVDVWARDDANNSAPVPRGLEARTVEGSPVNVTVPLEGIDADGDSVSLVGLGQAPTMGTVTVSSTWLTYTPSSGASGTDTFTYVVEDRLGAQATGTVRVGVASSSAVNTPPVAVDDLVVAQPGRTVAVDVLANDLDADGDRLSLQGAPVAEDPALEVSSRANQVLVTLPSSEGVYSLRYTVSDSRGGTAVGTVTLQVSSDAPRAHPVGVDDYVTVDQVDASGQVTVPVLDNDRDKDGSPWSLTLSTEEPDVQVVDKSLRLSVSQEPRTVLYTVTDADGLTGHAVVVVPALRELRPRVDASTVPVGVPADTSTDIPLSAHIQTRAGTSPVITDESTIHGGTGVESATLQGPGTLRLTPQKGFAGQTSVTFEVRDGTGSDALAATVTLPVLVTSTTNTPPTFTPTEVTVAPGEPPVGVSLGAMARDTDGDALTFSLGTVPAGLSATLSDSTLSVSATLDAQPGTSLSVPVTLSDGVNDPVAASVPVKVAASTRPMMTTVPATRTSDGSPVSVDVATLVTNPFPDKPITLPSTPVVTAGRAAVTTSGTVITISPEAGFYGRVLVQYRVMDASGLESRSVTGSVTVTVVSAPGAPTGVRATPRGATGMTVTWTPGPDHGAPITGYTVTEAGGAGQWSCTAPPCVATGLPVGGTYSFYVVAHNSAGDSPASATSTPVVLSVTPQVPTGVQLTGGEGALSARWNAVPDIEGVTITYEVRLQPRGGGSTVTKTVSGTSVEVQAPEVSVGTTYTMSVRAVPSAGTPSAYSAPSAPAAPYGAPGKPSAPTVTPSSEGVTVSWGAAPANGAPVTYTVNVTGATTTSPSAGGATRLSIPLDPGSYTFTVTATNRAGSATSDPTSYVLQTAPLAPSAPVAQATGVNGQVSVATPAYPRAGNGWSQGELSIQYSLDGSTWQSGTTFDGLTDGAPVILRARASGTTSDGSTLYSEPVQAASVTPYGPPSSPTASCTVSGSQWSCTWTPGATGGRANTYQWSHSGSATDGTPLTVGETKTFPYSSGSAFTWCVRATSDAGTSDWGCFIRGSVAPNPPSPGEKRTFAISPDSPDAKCSAQDLKESGFSQDSCWKIVVDIRGMRPSSVVECSYPYRERGQNGFFTYHGAVSLDPNGEAHQVFPHRANTRDAEVTCTQK